MPRILPERWLRSEEREHWDRRLNSEEVAYRRPDGRRHPTGAPHLPQPKPVLESACARTNEVRFRLNNCSGSVTSAIRLQRGPGFRIEQVHVVEVSIHSHRGAGGGRSGGGNAADDLTLADPAENQLLRAERFGNVDNEVHRRDAAVLAVLVGPCVCQVLWAEAEGDVATDVRCVALGARIGNSEARTSRGDDIEVAIFGDEPRFQKSSSSASR